MLNQPVLNPALSIVSAMITPAILILAAGSLVSSTLVRLGRIVDQTRALIAQAEKLKSQADQKTVALVEARINLQLRRAELARQALMGYYVSISLFLVSSLVIALLEAIHETKLYWIGPAIVIAGGAVLIFATATLLIEVNISAGTLREEVRIYRSR